MRDSQIEPLDELPEMEEAEPYRQQGEDALAHTLLLKLNGGLGTSMGLHQAKSLIPVHDHLTFLDIIARQVLALREHTGVPVPLVLMNSERTDADTHDLLGRYETLATGQEGIPLSFLQHRVPKLRTDSLYPIDWPDDPPLEWCPPGHGDIYTAMATSGLLAALRKRGYAYAFISNADNLGATLDLPLLGYFASREPPFMMEVTRRTEADRKGGHLARTRDGHLLLRERAQCPEDEVASFQDTGRYRFFNTNNLWINLNALDSLLTAHRGVLALPLIVNEKHVDPRNTESPAVYQLETAMGAAISLFDNAHAIKVPRSRFSPVKTTDDLLGLWSDAYELTGEMNMALHESRAGRPPDIQLDPAYYQRLDDFEKRFPAGAPSLRGCDRLVVEGDVLFEKGVVLQGHVHLRNTTAEQVNVGPDTAIATDGQPTKLA